MNSNEIDETPVPFISDMYQYVYLLWRWVWLILLVALLAGGAAHQFFIRQIPIYQASTMILVNSASSTQPADYSSILASQDLTSTYAQMVTNMSVLDEVAKRLGIDLNTYNLKDSITVKPMMGTQLISISVEMADPTWAARVANTIVQVFSEQILQMQGSRLAASSDTLKVQLDDVDKQIQDLNTQAAVSEDKAEQTSLQDRISQYRDIYSRLLASYEGVRMTEAQTASSVIQVDLAHVPTSPVRPKTTQNTLLAVVLGALLGIGAVVLMELLNDTIRDPAVFLKKFRLPILGVIAHHEQRDGEPIVKRLPYSPVAEAFRSLRTSVQYASVDKPLRTLLVTSPTPSDGKSTIASNLAVVLAQGGAKVFVVDADLRHPRIHHIMGSNNLIGLSSLFLQPTVHLNGTVQKCKIENVSVVSSGTLPPNPAELLGSQRMREILSVMQEQSDVVILDTPPVLSVTDAVVLAPMVDGVVLVVKLGMTQQAAFRQAFRALNHVGVNLLGVVINEAGGWGSYYDFSYQKCYPGYYEYRSPYVEAKKKQKPVRTNPNIIPE